MKRYRKNRRTTITIIVVFALILLGIGYAALTTVLRINSNITLGKATFAIHFDNVETATHKSEVIDEAHITNEAKTEISFTVSIPRLGDNYKFYTDIVNEGTIPGKVKSIELNGLTDSQKRLINYKVYYKGSNRLLSVGDFFGPNSSKHMIVEIIYELSDDVENEDLPSDNLDLECEFVINFEQGSIDEYRARAASSKLSQATNYMSSGSIHFNQTATSSEHQGVYMLDSTKDDDFPIYFYRGGSSTPNHVKLGDYCWRIIRTTETGGIKMLYNGVATDDGKCTASTYDQMTIGQVKWTTERYGSGNARTRVESWYFDHIIPYQEYLEDTVFCDKGYTNGDVDVSCPEENSYSLAKGNISYPVGLITAQEATLTGSSTNSGSFPWINNGNRFFWTMSYHDSGYYAWYVKDGGLGTGAFSFWGAQWDYLELRPVISLNSNVEFNEGNGTSNTPYIPSLMD